MYHDQHYGTIFVHDNNATPEWLPDDLLEEVLDVLPKDEDVLLL